jgi:hypothetical protein
LRLQKKKADDRILAGVEIPAPGKKPAFEEKPVGLKKQAAYCLGSAESPVADFFLVWLMSSRSDPRRYDESRLQSPSEEKAQAALLLWAALSRIVPAACTGPTCQEMAQIHAATKSNRRPLGILLIPVKSQNS